MQSNKTCKICGDFGHSKYYCPKKIYKNVKKTKKMDTNTSLKKARRTEPLDSLKTKKQGRCISRKQLVTKLDWIFSKYIRLRDDGVCVTCGMKKDCKEMQCGHFYSRGRYPTRWDEQNCNCQCYRCNICLKGNYIEYTKFMINKYGMEFVDELGMKSINGVKTSSLELKEKI